MFELAQELEKWRSQLLASNTYLPSDVDELESHLLDEMDRLKRKKLTEDEAFWVARHRIGDVKSLSEEFGKVNTGLIWRQRLLWIVGGYVGIGLLGLLYSVAPSLAAMLGFKAGLEPLALIYIEAYPKAILLGCILLLAFSQKVRNGLSRSRVAKKGFEILRRHYIVVWLLALALYFLLCWAVMPWSAQTWFDLPKLNIWRGYFSMAWNVFMWASFITLAISMNRLKRPSAA